MLSIMGMMLIPGGIIPVHAAPGDQLLTINNPSPATNDQFGWSVATTDNGNLLVGAYEDDTGASDAGSAYLFDGTLRGTTSTPLLTINNPTPASSDHFGISVATTTNGNILVSAPFDDTGASSAGSAYLFDGTDGSLLLTINNPSPATGDKFGWSVATTDTGDLLVGAHGDNTGASDAGSVYLFDGTDGSLLLTINNPSPATGDKFGFSVATTDTGNLLVGAYEDDTGASDAGSVYLFDGTLRGTTSIPLLTINNPTPASSDHFGISVATTNTGDLLVGALRDDTGATDSGSAYLFDGTLRGTTSTPLLTINNPTPEAHDEFGFSVATTDTGNLLVGAYDDDTGASGAGSVYLFEDIFLQQILYCGQPESYYNVIDGTESSDYLVGTSSPDLIFGNGGNDMIYALGENNCIYAGSGNDFVLANKDGNTVYGGAGDDSIMLKGTGIAYGEDGDDAIYIMRPSAGHLLDGGNGSSDLCVTNARQSINTANCEIVP